jgi:hypothetical protein
MNLRKSLKDLVGAPGFEPPAPKDWSHEESTTCTEGDELLPNATRLTIPNIYRRETGHW